MQTLQVLKTYDLGHKMNRKTHIILLLRLKSEHYLCKSTESNHIQNLCHRILRSCLIHFLGPVSTGYFSQLLPIAKCSPQSLPHHFPISTAPWLLPYCYHYCYRIVFPSTWGWTQSHAEMIFFSPTEIPHGRHEQGGIRRKWRQDCSTISGRYMQNICHHCHPFHRHHPQIWFSAQNFLLLL